MSERYPTEESCDQAIDMCESTAESFRQLDAVLAARPRQAA
ncbi:hypothetical protein [Piscinibacter koreensis]|nr:hypothetical protein [Schlegelella koreensis]